MTIEDQTVELIDGERLDEDPAEPWALDVEVVLVGEFAADARVDIVSLH